MNDVLQFTSDYLIPGVTGTQGPGFHRVTLSWSPAQRGGTLQLDPNVCGLDRFGDPTICTLMAIAPYQMRLTLVLEEAGKRLYAIEAHHAGPAGAQSYSGPPLRLVTMPDPEALGHLRARLLVLEKDQITRIIDLHPVHRGPHLPVSPPQP